MAVGNPSQNVRRDSVKSVRRSGLGLAAAVVVLALVAVAALRFIPAPLGSGAPKSPGASEATATVQRISATFENIQQVWRGQFGSGYRPPDMTFSTGVAVGPCSGGAAATGPFYCPERVEAVFDLTFFGALNARLRRNGDLGMALVVAMVSAAAVQDQLGLLDGAEAARRGAGTAAERRAVDEGLATQADCLAGVWAALAGDSVGPVPEGFYDQLIGIARNVMEDHASLAPDMPAGLDPFQAASREMRQANFAQGYGAADPAACLPEDAAATR